MAMVTISGCIDCRNRKLNIERPQSRRLTGRYGSLCKPLHSDPYAQVATMRRWAVANDADPSVAKRWQGARVKIWT